LREERRLRVFDRVLGRKFGPEWNEITSEWRNVGGEEPNDLYSSHNIVGVNNREEFDGCFM